ncbi:MAG TPA: M28 family peptidase [Kofleriaceae bacterium]|nr:M28 family peptidase [Kofleriaceae bacterium]
MRVLLLFAVAACGSDDVTSQPDATGCALPVLDAPWLETSLSTWVGRLATAPRATFEQRAAARGYLVDELQHIGWTPQEQVYPTGSNIYAVIPAHAGSGKPIVVGAHFDTVMSSPGANDNASGTAVVLAIARYLRDTPCRTAPVIVAFFDQEEVGLFGARAFAMMLDPAQTRSVHTIDQVAYDGDRDKRYELEQPTPALQAAYVTAAATIGVTVTATSTGGTDHVAFRDRGFAAIGLTEEYAGGDTSPFRHLATDTPVTVDTPYLVDAAKLTAHVILGEATQ